MMGATRYIAWTLSVMLGLLALGGCHRRPLEDPADYTAIRVKVNVKGILNVTCDVYNEKIPVPKIEPDAMHVIFFDKKGGSVAAETFITDVQTDADGVRSLNGSISIMPGAYKMLVYDFGTEATLIRDYYDYEKALAYTDPVPAMVANQFKTRVDDNQVLYGEPDHLVVASSESEEIPYHDELYTIYTDAKSVVESWYLQIKVDGLEYVSGANAVLSGMASGNFIATDTRVENPPSSLWFELRKSDDKGTPVICAVFNTFGHIDKSQNDLNVTFNIKTTGGKTVLKTFDISSLFETENAVKHHWLLLEETIKIDPPATGGGAFDPKVDDWDEEHRDIEI